MPIYEYRCDACGFQKEFLQKVNDAPHTACPACGQSALKKLLSAAGFHLKGSGWYATDFKNAAKPAAKKTEGDSKPTENTPADSKSADSKPADTAPACGGGACPACTT